MANMSTPLATTMAVITIALSGGHAGAQSVARIELQPIQTVTLKTQQILTGDTKGAPATLAGELRIPKPGSERLPAVVLTHGSGGVGGNVDAWAKEILIRRASPSWDSRKARSRPSIRAMSGSASSTVQPRWGLRRTLGSIRRATCNIATMTR